MCSDGANLMCSSRRGKLRVLKLAKTKIFLHNPQPQLPKVPPAPAKKKKKKKPGLLRPLRVASRVRVYRSNGIGERPESLTFGHPTSNNEKPKPTPRRCRHHHRRRRRRRRFTAMAAAAAAGGLLWRWRWAGTTKKPNNLRPRRTRREGCCCGHFNPETHYKTDPTRRAFEGGGGGVRGRLTQVLLHEKKREREKKRG